MMRRILVTLAVAVGIALLTAPSFAQSRRPEKLQVVAVSSADAYQQAQALTIALKRAVQRSENWTLGSGDYSLEVMVAAFNCRMPPDSKCQQRIGGKIGTHAYIWGRLKRSGSDVVAHLRLWQDGAQKRDTTIRYSANLTDASDDTLLAIARNAFDSLVGAAMGKVLINAGDVDGDVLIDGRHAGSIKDGHAELSVSVGEHEIRVRAAGYHEAVGTATVNAGETAQVTLAPTPVNAGAGSTGNGPGAGAAEHPSDFRKIAGYTGIGVGGAIALTGGYFWLKSFLQSQNPSATYKKYQGALGPSADVCDAADHGVIPTHDPDPGAPAEVKNTCDTNAHTKTLAFVLLPIGAVIAGVGTYLLLTDKSSSSERPSGGLKFMPDVAIGPHGGSVDVNVAF
jgi:PEGA domain